MIIASILYAACKAYDEVGKYPSWNDLSERDKSVWYWLVNNYSNMNSVPLGEKERMCYFLVNSLK